MLAPIDMLVFDLQDIGCRSYTYISTMVVAMEACAENGKAFVVLDRPNPMGGWRVEGPPLESKWKSFVGQIPVPYVHGMTAGELAMMTGAQRWITRTPRLNVVKMQGWSRNMTWQDTGRRWYRTSPNIPYATSPLYYVATGILGGASAVDIGIGMLDTLNRLSGGRVMNRMSGSKLNLFHKVYGSETLYNNLRSGVPASRIVAGWSGSVNSFRNARQRHLLYA
jgi:uncharacterized protein YbbC (DUF1343 family)